MGCDGLCAALPRGGQINDEYPANLANYVDSLIKKHWKNNHIPDSSFQTSDEALSFVSYYLVIQISVFFSI